MNNSNQERVAEKEKITDIVILKEIFKKTKRRSGARENRQESSVFSIVWRLLLICLIIDGGIYLYLHLVKKVTVSEGIKMAREWVYSTAPPDSQALPPPFPSPLISQPPRQETMSRPSAVPVDISKRSSSNVPPISSASSPVSYQGFSESVGDLCTQYKVCNVKPLSLKGKVFSWKDKDGKLHFSNTNFPLENETLKVEAEINSNSFYSITKFLIRENQILIPVTLLNRGKSVNTHMVLDTGCTHTTAPLYLLDKLNVTYTGDVTSTLANGNTTKGKRTTIDTLIVGPRRAINIPITGAKISGSMNMGLLGMNFLKSNPFQIDFEKQMIVWM